MRLHTCVGLLSLFWLACFGFSDWTGTTDTLQGEQGLCHNESPHMPPPLQSPPLIIGAASVPKSEDSRESRPYRFRAVHIWLRIIYIALFAQPAMSARVAADSTPAAGVHEREAPSRLVQFGGEA